MENIDWALMVMYLLISIGISFYFKNRGTKDKVSFFLGGRSLPWYLAGLSMVATTFAADTPLLITELVHSDGISGNWLWWNMLIGGMLTTFFFSKLWYRAGTLTELEFLELRYDGKASKFLRGFKSIYLGIFLNTLIIGWVNLALGTILQIFFDIPTGHVIYYIAAAMIISSLLSAISGLLGTIYTDAFQFIIAMTGSIILAFAVVSSEPIGGLSGLKTQLTQKHGAELLNFFPNIGSAADAGGVLSISILSFIAFIGIQWWSSWYPGAEPGGGGYVAQRMMSTKSEKDSLWATLFFQIMHFAIRPWPWILVGLSTILLYPDLAVDAKREGYVMAIKDFLPAGAKGLMLVALLAAYMSTISTQLNWGTSFIVHDLYHRFIAPNSEDTSKDIYVSRISMLIIMIISILVTMAFDTIKGVFEFLVAGGAGLGLVLILRWFWWRINAWSEISATFFPLISLGIIKAINPEIEFENLLIIQTVLTSVVWLTFTFITKPVSNDRLLEFYRRVRPIGRWPFHEENIAIAKGSITMTFISWVLGISLVYCTLFFIGDLLLLNFGRSVIFGITAAISGIGLYYSSKKII